MVSLKDIAKTCGVSVATVSKALNNQKDIGEDTKAKIRETAAKMGYFPNSAARALKTRRSYNLGVLFQDEAGRGLTHEYFGSVLNGFKVQAENLGYDISFLSSASRTMSYYEHCRYRNFDGVVIVCVDFREPKVQELLNSDIPMVTIDYIQHNCSSVSSDNVGGMKELLTYIYNKGHRRVAYIHGENFSYVTKERLASFYRTAEALGLEVPEKFIWEAKYLETKQAAQITRGLINLKDAPTCIIYPDDASSIGGRNAIMEAGLRIGSDISIAGYDGHTVSQLIHPKLTTVSQNADKIGREAAKCLVNSIEKPKTTLLQRVVIEGSLIPGQSVEDFSGVYQHPTILNFS